MIDWRVFKVEDVFDVRGTVRWKSSDFEGITTGYKVKSGSIFNNGNSGLFSNNYDNLGNCITIEGLTMGKAFYEKSCFKTISDMTLLYNEKNLNKYNALFLISILNKCNDLYCYGYKLVKGRLKNLRIKLPVTSDGEIDWYYMEAEGKRAEEEALKRSPLYSEIKEIKMDKKVKKEIKKLVIILLVLILFLFIVFLVITIDFENELLISTTNKEDIVLVEARLQALEEN